MPKITPRKRVGAKASASSESPSDAPAKRRKPLGRRLGSSLLGDDPSVPPQVYTLSSGRQVEFHQLRVDAGDVEKLTYVDPLVNGREQVALTRESVSDLCQTIVHQQFFPAIGRRGDDQRIEILDGSRRRAAAIFTEVGLDLLVTHAQLNLEEARQLAAAIQTAREHNLREVGLRLKSLLEASEMTQAQLAEAQGLSAAKVTRALHAASVPASLLSVFPIQSELTYPDYRALKELGERFEAQPKRLESLIVEVEREVGGLSSDLPPDQYKSEVMRCYQRASSVKSKKPRAERPQVTQLWKFSDKNTYARKRTKGRTLSFEFSRLPASLQRELESAVVEVLTRRLEDEG